MEREMGMGTFVGPLPAPFLATARATKAPACFLPARVASLQRCRRAMAPAMSAAVPAGTTRRPSGGRNLRADDFRHPVDAQATRALRSLVGLEFGLRRILATVEQTMTMDNVANGIRVSEQQLPHLQSALSNAAQKLQLPGPLPTLYVKQSPVPNAYTLAFQGKDPFIVVHTSLLDLLTEQEVEAVLAHELGHLKLEHGVYVTLANALNMAVGSIFRGSIGSAMSEWFNYQVLRWLRAAELSCDRAALLVVEDPKVVMSVIMKLSGGSATIAKELNLDEWIKQAEDFDKQSTSPFGRVARRAMTENLTHPLPVLRAREIQKYSKTEGFKRLSRSIGLPSTSN